MTATPANELTLEDPTSKPETHAQRMLRENDSVEMRNSRNYLAGMTRTMTNIYGGTVDKVTIAERRAKNKRARKARRNNR